MHRMKHSRLAVGIDWAAACVPAAHAAVINGDFSTDDEDPAHWQISAADDVEVRHEGEQTNNFARLQEPGGLNESNDGRRFRTATVREQEPILKEPLPDGRGSE